MFRKILNNIKKIINNNVENLRVVVINLRVHLGKIFGVAQPQIVSINILITKILILSSCLFLITCLGCEDAATQFFFQTWTLKLWVFTLGGTIVVSIFMGSVFKWLIKKIIDASWTHFSTRFLLIINELFINFTIGILVVHNKTYFAGLVLICPLAISPAIYIIELLIFGLYCIIKYHHSKVNDNK